ncbi:alpha-aminoadipic semialdehyde synthase, mitochondrial [Aplysia californica]|uniref:Alpha-aminoadipic semialdehyde synthase, mitochondrial n=1 Tax=Aplysia californica TaxID=6500 RepID=A0ABM0JS69_APLCA|nr:alpha-aminoadipic semialdehyde synthase, mitochondrial [Aplysia californica]XP_005100304.1 alpha-aminoadipic semialdehyde synthase, mitochondrial [Aplysia californica]XP_005100305.1 alpha-aminoadipic semialdehyde synthase, mitochondrial [Aplysia californica]XP_005100306.1 alpha-aminoadipic semialdehyde synthase, mitochondrial [Aplysia californica]
MSCMLARKACSQGSLRMLPLLWRGGRVLTQTATPALCSVHIRSSSQQPVMAVRRETVNVWERRAPLSPQQVRKLVRKGVKVIVQPSDRRAYSMKEYSDIGAVIKEDMSEASLIIGVKQVPIDSLMRDKTYAFFSHTIKAQADNMPLLDAILEKNIRLIDYEKMVDEYGQRVVAFGKYAGVSGMINILHGMGLRLLALGHHTPFMFIGPSHNYRHTEMARQAVRDAGYEIALGRMPRSIGPLTFVFTGSGNVSQGAQEVFTELPHEYIEPEHLPKVAARGSTNKIYACVVSRDDHYIHKNGGKFNADEFEQYPERYASTFSHNIAPYASCIINGIYWAPGAPRLITIPEAKTLLRPTDAPWIPSSPGCPTLPHRLLAICDISADPGGSIEFMKECTTIDKPFSLYDAEQNVDKESFAGDGVLLCSIDNMPAQIPREATDFFGSLLLPYVSEMLKSDAKQSFEDYSGSPIVKNAVIASNGSLAPNYGYIQDLRTKSASAHKAVLTSSSERVLILGAGYVSGPVVEYLTRDPKTCVTVASHFQKELDDTTQLCPEVIPLLMDLETGYQDLEKHLGDHDLVISLLPYAFHTEVAKLCIKHRKNMVTASYISPDMKQLHSEAVAAGITIMNEVGVDPGIDHMLAMECFDEVKRAGGKVTSFVSYCGGLPAPEHSDSPLLYKFSWYPKGVLLNCMAGARYLQGGQVVDVPSEGGLLDSVRDLNFLPGFNLEGFPNRDSTIYAKEYGIESAHTILRGTIRYKGFTEAAKSLISLGLFDTTPDSQLHPNGPDITWKAYICGKFGKSEDILQDSLVDLVFDQVERDPFKLSCVVNLGLLEDDLIDKRSTPIDTLSNYLAKRLAYAPHERDMILMRHEVGIQWGDGKREHRGIDLVNYGDPNGFSAMARTVGLPTGIAARMILAGEIQTKGVCAPMAPETYVPILARLKKEGITALETINLL